MPETIVNKQCTKCKEIKTLSEFYKDSQKSATDGYRFWCKDCWHEKNIEYRHTEKGRLVYKRFKQSDKGKKADKKYEQSEKGRISRRRQVAKYRKTDKGKKQSQINIKKWREKYPEKLKAEQQVQYAIHKGIMKSAFNYSCIKCSKQARHYHHPSYEPEHWLDVVPVCHSCHTMIHNINVLSSVTG